MILGTARVHPDHTFICCDCDEEFSGTDLIDGSVCLHIVRDNPEIEKCVFRCECCQDDVDERD